MSTLLSCDDRDLIEFYIKEQTRVVFRCADMCMGQSRCWNPISSPRLIEILIPWVRIHRLKRELKHYHEAISIQRVLANQINDTQQLLRKKDACVEDFLGSLDDTFKHLKPFSSPYLVNATWNLSRIRHLLSGGD